MTITQRVEYIESKLSLLDEDNLKNISAKVKLMQHEIEQVETSQNNDPIKSEYEDKVNQLYQYVDTVDMVCGQLPKVVTRLEQLKHIHEKNANLHKTISTVQKDQQKVNTLVSDQGLLLKQLETNLASNMAQMNKNIQLLEEKMKQLQ